MTAHARLVRVGYASLKLTAVAGAVAGAVGVGLLLTGAGKPVAKADLSARAPAVRASAVCFGHADLETGIMALAPSHPGSVTAVLVRENEEVKEGAVLLRMDSALARLRVAEARAALSVAQRQLSQTQTLIREHELRIAQQQSAVAAMEERLGAAGHLCDHKQQLYELNQLNVKDLEVARNHVRELRAMKNAEQTKLEELKFHKLSLESDGVSRARAEVSVMEARLGQAQEILDQCDLRAPTAGRVLRILTGPGELLGMQAKQPAVQFWPKNEPLIIRAEVDQEFSHVREGQLARVEDYYDGTGVKGTGRIKRVSFWYTQRRTLLDDPMQFKDVRTLECIVGDIKLEGQGNGQPLRIGQRMKVIIPETP